MIRIPDIKPWSPDCPNLYQIEVVLKCGETILQCFREEWWYRQLVLDRDSGLLLNGVPIKLKGVCLHHDQGALGAASYPDAVKRQLLLLEDMGVNAIRSTHNPASQTLKQLANQLGFLVIDEAFDTWLYAKNGNYHDYSKWFAKQIGQTATYLLGANQPEMTWAEFHLKQMIKSGRNMPAIVFWSLGNELLEGHSHLGESYPATMKQLLDWVAEVDKSRPLTFGDNKLKWDNAVSVRLAEVIQEHELDGVIGYNYADGKQYDETHQQHSDWVIYGSETFSAVNSRGIYHVKGDVPTPERQLTSYDQSKVAWGRVASQAWYDTIRRDFVLGEFVWTGFDYLGEPTPWNSVGKGAVSYWPSPKHSYFGILDTAGFPKDTYYFYRSQWQDKDITLHVLPTWKENLVAQTDNGLVEVVVYSNANTVQLLFRDEFGQVTDYGKQSFEEEVTPSGHRYQICQTASEQLCHQNLYLTLWIPYRSGQLQALAYDKNGQLIEQTIGRSEVATFGLPTRLVANLSFPKANYGDGDLVYVEIGFVDANDLEVFDASLPVTVLVNGPARLLAMDNGNATDHTPYQSPKRQAFSGRVLAIVQTLEGSGQVTVQASSDHCQSACLTFLVSSSDSSCRRKSLRYQYDKIYYLPEHQSQFLPESMPIDCDGQVQEWLVTYRHFSHQEGVSGTHYLAIVEQLSLAIPIKVERLERVVALKNIAYALPVGSQLRLPNLVEGYYADGSCAGKLFDVIWDSPNGDIMSEAGIIKVLGFANVFGQKQPVTASVRIAETTLFTGDDVAPRAVTISDSL